MSLESPAKTHQLAAEVLAKLRALDVPASPENFTLFYEHHSGTNPALQRVMDVLLTSGSTFEESTLHDLHLHFLSSVKEENAVREASTRVLSTLQEVIGFTEAGGEDARSFQAVLHGLAGKTFGDSVDTLRQAIIFLVGESARMAGRTECLGAQMRQSSEKIHALERNLESAVRDATQDALTGASDRKAFEQTI